MPSLFPISPDWQSWGGFATVVAVPIALVAALAAYWQLRELARSRKLEALAGAFELLSSERSRADRALAYLYAEAGAPEPTPAALAAINRVSVDFERIASLTRLRLVPERELVSHHSEVIVRAWDAVKTHIDDRRARFGGEHASNFKWLAKRASKYRERSGVANSLHTRGPSRVKASDA